MIMNSSMEEAENSRFVLLDEIIERQIKEKSKACTDLESEARRELEAQYTQ